MCRSSLPTWCFSASPAGPPLPGVRRPTHRTPDDDPLARKAAWAVAFATQPDVAAVSALPTSPLPLGSARRAPPHSRPDWSAARDESSPAETSTRVYVAQYRAPPAPVVCLVPSVRRRPTLPVSLPLPRFAVQNFALDPVTTPSHLVATQLYPGGGGG